MSVSLSQINQKAEVSSNDVYLVLSCQAEVPKRRLGRRQRFSSVASVSASCSDLKDFWMIFERILEGFWRIY